MQGTEQGFAGRPDETTGGVYDRTRPSLRVTGEIGTTEISANPLDAFTKLYDDGKVIGVNMHQVAFVHVDPAAERETINITFIGGVSTKLVGPVARQFMAQAAIPARKIVTL